MLERAYPSSYIRWAERQQSHPVWIVRASVEDVHREPCPAFHFALP